MIDLLRHLIKGSMNQFLHLLTLPGWRIL